MRVRHNYYNNVIEINFKGVQASLIQDGTAPEERFNASFEKEIEHLWSQSRHLGWSYDDFVTHLLEVLTVVRFRDKIKLPSSPAKKA